VLWYPAKFIERHQGRAGKKEEYEFRWLECTDGETFNSATSDLPLMMQRTFFKACKFCQAIDEVKLAEKQVRVSCRRTELHSHQHTDGQNLHATLHGSQL
jgi:hypothetical protein